MAGNLKPLELTVRAVDRATATIRQINDRIESMTAPVRRVGESFSKLGKEMRLPAVGKAIGKVGKEVQALGRSALYGSAGLLAAGAAINRFIDFADQIPVVAKKAGVLTSELQEYRYAAELLDTPQEVLDRGLERFNKNVVDVARNVGKARYVFQQLDISLRDGTGAFKTNAVLLDEFREKVRKIKDEDVRGRFIEIAFGAREMAGFVEASSDEIARLRMEARELGVVLDDAAIARAGEADDALKKFKFAARGLGHAIATELLPDITAVAKEWTAWLKNDKNREMIKNDIVPAIKNLGSALKFVASMVLGMTQSLGGTIALFAVAGAVMFGPLIASIIQLGLAFASFLFRIPGVEAAVMGFVRSMGARVFPFLITSIKAIGAAILTTPVGWILLAAAAFLLLYKNCKPFADFVDGTFQRFLDGAKRAGQWLGLIDDPEARMGTESEQAERARARIRDMRARGVVEGARDFRARDFAQKPQTWQGMLNMRVGVEKGAQVYVDPPQSSGPEMDMNLGPIMR